MQPFRPEAAGGAFRCEVAFRGQPYANLSFWDGARQEILFHLSLRAAKGMAAVNARGGGGWGRERRRPLGPALAVGRGGRHRVEIRFEGARIRVAVNGVSLFDLDGAFPGAEGIAWLGHQGGVLPESLPPPAAPPAAPPAPPRARGRSAPSRRAPY